MNKRLKYCFLWIACVVVNQLHAQSVFNVLDSNAFGLREFLIFDEKIYAVGSAFNPSGSGTLVLMKFDSANGNTLASDTFSVDGVATYNGSLIQIPNDSEKLLLFNTSNSIAPYNPTTADFQLTQLDTNFNEFSTMIFGGGAQENSFQSLTLNESIFLYGATESFGAGSFDLYLSKFDTSGNQLWEVTYGSAEFEDSRSFTLTNDDNLILLGVRRVVSPNWDLYIVKVDPSDGNVIWEKQFGGPYEDYSGEITALHDHSFIVYHNVKNDGISHIGYIEKLDGNGDLIWSKAFPYNDLSSFSYGRAIENPDGTLIVNNAVKNSNGKMISRILKLDPFGNIIWEKEYYTNPNWPQYINDIRPSSDGGYVLCGSARNLTLEQNVWLIKTNCLGEEGVQYPVTGAPCDLYDCTQFQIDASFSSSATYIDLGVESGEVSFENNSDNTTSRVWHFGDGTTDYTDSIISHTYTQPGIYEVELIVFHGMCSDTVSHSIEVLNTAGVLSPNLDYGVLVFPNPSNGSFEISFKYAPEGFFEIVDLSGRIHLIEELNGASSYKIDTLNRGTYILHITYPSGKKEIKRIEVF